MTDASKDETDAFQDAQEEVQPSTVSGSQQEEQLLQSEVGLDSSEPAARTSSPSKKNKKKKKKKGKANNNTSTNSTNDANNDALDDGRSLVDAEPESREEASDVPQEPVAVVDAPEEEGTKLKDNVVEEVATVEVTEKAETGEGMPLAPQGTEQVADDHFTEVSDPPLSASTQPFDISQDMLTKENEALEAKLDALKVVDDDEVVVQKKKTVEEVQVQLQSPSPVVPKLAPELPDRSPISMHDSDPLPELPPRDTVPHVATTAAPPPVPEREIRPVKKNSQEQILKAASELAPPPLPPQLTAAQKQQHQRSGSILQSWFQRTSSTRGSTTSLSEKSVIDYDENYDLLLSRLNENSEEYSARDEVSKEQINSTHDTLRSSFAEKVPKSSEETAENFTSSDDSELHKIDWPFWTRVVNDYSNVVKTEPSKLANELSGGIPTQIRGIVWQLVSNSNPQEFQDIYDELKVKESKNERSIAKDLQRTRYITDHDIDSEALQRVLRAYSNLDSETGYTQGMAFIAVPLLMNMNELEAFGLLHKLMNGYNVRSLYLPEMPGLLLKLYQFDRIVEDLLPNLHIHFQRQGIRSSMYASQWFLTFFAYRFPLEFVLRIFDIIITEGIEAILKFAIALVQKNEQTLLTLKFDQLLEYLKDNLFTAYKIEPSKESTEEDDESNDGGAFLFKKHTAEPITVDAYNVDEFVEDATNVKIVPITLQRYQEEYEEIHREEKERREEVEELRLRNNQLRKEIRKVEASYTILNREHVQIANEMIGGRMKIAELEDENKDLRGQNQNLRERVKTLQNNPLGENVPVPTALEEDLKRTMDRNLEVMTKNEELEDMVQTLSQEVEELRAQLKAEQESKKIPSGSPEKETPVPHKSNSIWGKKLFK